MRESSCLEKSSYLFIFLGTDEDAKLPAKGIQKFFEPENVGLLSSNIEEKFGLSSIMDKWVMLCTEVKKDFHLNQAEFQSMVSGESISIAQKNQKTHQMKWTAPGLLCGNE